MSNTLPAGLDIGGKNVNASQAVNIYSTTNQVVLGTTNTTTLNSTAPSASRVYTIPDAGADCNVMLARPQIITAPATGTVNLTVAQSGSIIFMPQATGNTTHNLPAPSSGVNFKFIITDTANGSNTRAITATSTLLFGTIIGPGGADTDVLLVNGATTLTLSATANNVKKGDFLYLFSDGTNWYVDGRSGGSAVGWAAS